MTRDDDKARADQFALCLDLGALVADARADRAESLPDDPVIALAVAVLSCVDPDTLAHLLTVPEEIAEGAAHHLHAEVRHALILAALKEMGNKARTKGKND